MYGEFINEAYSPEMKKKFTPAQLSEIGNFMNSKENISVQNSEMEYYRPYQFRMKMAKEHSYIICKLKDGNYVIMKYVSSREAKIIKNTSDIEFFDYKEVIDNSSDVFVFVASEDTYSLKKQRADAKRVYSKDTDSQKEKKLYKFKAKKYITPLVDEASKLGYKLKLQVVDYIDEYGVYSELDQVDSMSDKIFTIRSHFPSGETVKNLNDINKRDQYTIEINKKSFSVSELKNQMDYIERLVDLADKLNHVDYTKLPVFG